MLDFLIAYGYIGVFLAAFLAATILPFSSEVVMAGVMAAGASYWPLILSATAGNVLGGMTCYWLGHLGKREWISKYLGMKQETVDKWTRFLRGKGSWMAFWVFLPGVGDFFAVALGLLRANVWSVFAFMTAGKFLRYVALGEGLKYTTDNWRLILSWLKAHPAVPALLILALLALGVWYLTRHDRRSERSEAEL